MSDFDDPDFRQIYLEAIQILQQYHDPATGTTDSRILTKLMSQLQKTHPKNNNPPHKHGNISIKVSKEPPLPSKTPTDHP